MSASALQRLSFWDVFEKKSGDRLMPKRIINVNGVILGPGVTFSKGVDIAGVDFFNYDHLDIAGEQDDNVLVIRGFFNRESSVAA
jgi:hypothetical protein